MENLKNYIDEITDTTGLNSEELYARSEFLFALSEELEKIKAIQTGKYIAKHQDLYAAIDDDLDLINGKFYEFSKFLQKQAVYLFDCAEEIESDERLEEAHIRELERSYRQDVL
jgi:L-rhamnose mutarotase